MKRGNMASIRQRRQFLACLVCCVALPGLLGVVVAGDDQLPTEAKVKQQQAKFQSERDKLLQGGAKLFQPELMARAEVFARKAEEALTGGRLLQAKQAFVQARWQLPYLGPTVPEHVARVLGDLRLRHSGGINQLAYSPDGKHLATASDDRSVKIWDLENGHEIRQLVGHGDAVRTLAYSADGKLLASAGGDDYIKLWDLADGKARHTLRDNGGYVNSVVFSPDDKYLISAWSNKAIRIFETDSGNLLRSIDGFQQQIESLAFSPDNKFLGAAAGDGHVYLFEFPRIVENQNQREYWGHNDLQGASYHITFSPDGQKFSRCYASGVKIYTIPDPMQPAGAQLSLRTIPLPKELDLRKQPVRFKCSVFSKDGKTLFTGGTDGIIRLYDASSGQLLGTLKGHNEAITSLAWNRQGSELASSSADHTVRLWPFDIVSQAREFTGHKGEVWMAALSPDVRRIVSASADKTLHIWDAKSGKVLHTLEGHASPVTVALFSPDGTAVLSAAGDRTLKIWDADTGKLTKTLEGHNSTVTAADFSPDGETVVSGSVDKTIKIWDLNGLKSTIETPSIITAVIFHPDGKRIASGHIDQTIRLWDTATGQAETSWPAHSEAVSALSFDNQGDLLASCGADGLVKVWPMENPGSDAKTLAGHKGPLSAVALRGDGKLVLSGGSDGVVKLWEVGESKKEPQDYRGHKDWITSVAFSKDGYFFASTSIDKTIRLWELTTKELPLQSEHTGAVKAVAVSPDGKLLASAATDQTIKIWDLKTGVEKLTLRGYPGQAFALAFAPDSKTLFGSLTDRNIYRWDVNTGRLLPAENNNWTGLVQPSPLVQVTSDGKKLLAWTPVNSFSTRVKVFDLPGGELLMEGTDQNRHVLAAAFTPDGKKVALAAADGSIRIYLVDNNRMEVQPGGDWFRFRLAEKVVSVALSPDGKLIAAGSEQGEIKIANADQRQVLHTLKGHTSKVRACVISPDGKRLATSGDDNVIKIWDLQTGKELRAWDIAVPEQIDRNFAPQLVFTPDSKHLITANANTTLYVLELP